MSTYELGVQSPFVLHAIGAYERAFKYMEETLAEGGPWLLGEQVTLADINMMPFVARLAYLGLLDVWVADRPHIKAWWERVQKWPSFKIGPERSHHRNRICRDGETWAEDPRRGGGAAARSARRDASEGGVAGRRSPAPPECDGHVRNRIKVKSATKNFLSSRASAKRETRDP